MAEVTRLIADLGDELTGVLGQVEELLLTFAVWEADPREPRALPAPLAGGVALTALSRVRDAVAATQTRTNRPPPAGGRLYGPDGRYEHRPLRLAALTVEDLVVLAEAAAVLGCQVAGRGELYDAIAATAEAAGGPHGPAPTPAQLVEGFARALGVLDLAETDPGGDTATLTARLAAAEGADVVLSPAEEAAYARVADRINTMWTSGSGSDRFLY